MKLVVLLGRVLFSLIFIVAGLRHFSSAMVDYAGASGVPYASILVPLSGGLALLGGLSIAFGFKAKLGAWLIVLFLVPVTAMMHNFWAARDANFANLQQIMFLKNLALLGGALVIAYFGAGPASFDYAKKRVS